MKSDSPANLGSNVFRLEETSSMPINRCDSYNVVYISPYSNTVVMGVSNGVLFMTLRQEKPAATFQHEFFTDAGKSISPDGSPNSSCDASPISNKSEQTLFRTSLQIVSAVDIDFQSDDPLGRYRPSFIKGLTEREAEDFYYDRFLSQKPLSRPALNRGLCKSSGVHVTKIFSTLVGFDCFDEKKTGTEVVIAVTSTGGWYIFACTQWVNPQRPLWQRIDSWRSVAPLLRRPITPECPTSPSESCSGYLQSLHSLCTNDLAAAESRNGRLLLFLINGLNQLLAYVVDIFDAAQQNGKVSPPASKSNSPNSNKSDPHSLKIGKCMDLPGESDAISCCYISQSRTFVFGREDGRIYLLQKISPHCPPETAENCDLKISYESSQVLWPHSDLISVSLLQLAPVLSKTVSESQVLVAAKGSFLIAWILPDSVLACAHVDAFPIISISTISDLPTERDCIANFVVCTQKGVFMTSLTKPSSNEAQLICQRILSIDEVSSPLGKNPNHSQGAAHSAIPTDVASLLNESFRKRHLSLNQWLFLGFAGSPNLNFFVAATGIFYPSRSSILLAPSFSLKVLSKKKVETPRVTNPYFFWDEPLYELATSVKTESALIQLIEDWSKTEGEEDFSTLSYRFVVLQKACIAFSSACLGVSAPPEVLAVKNALKRALIKMHFQNLVQRLLPFEAESEQNLVKYHGYLHDLATMCSCLKIDLPKRFGDLLVKFGEVAAFARQECPVCKMMLTTKLAEEEGDQFVLKCVCSNNHVFRPCSKSLLPFVRDGLVPIMPSLCPGCSEPALKFRMQPPEGNRSLFENCLSSILRIPCIFCGSNVLP